MAWGCRIGCRQSYCHEKVIHSPDANRDREKDDDLQLAARWRREIQSAGRSAKQDLGRPEDRVDVVRG